MKFTINYDDCGILKKSCSKLFGNTYIDILLIFIIKSIKLFNHINRMRKCEMGMMHVG